MPEKFDIYSKIFYMDVEKFVRHLCRLVLRHQMLVWNYFVNSFYSVRIRDPVLFLTPGSGIRTWEWGWKKSIARIRDLG